MGNGILSGLFWATDTVLIHNIFTIDGIKALPMIIAFIHDFISVFVISSVLLYTRNLQRVFKDIQLKGAKYIALAALLGGPIGLSTYILAIHYLGTYFACIITSLYPALGALCARILLGERRKVYQWIALCVSIISVMALGMSYESTIENVWIGLGSAIVCTFAWGSEAVVCSWVMRDYQIQDTSALWIRQVSASLIGFIIITIVFYNSVHWDVVDVVGSNISLLSIAAICGSLSYFFYYSSIHKIGASRAMAINSSYSGFAILINLVTWNVWPGYEEIILGLLIVGGGVVSAYDFKE